MKKSLIWILVLGLVLIFSACGTQNPPSPSQSADNTQASAAAGQTATDNQPSASPSEAPAASSNDIIASLAQIPGLSDSPDKGAYVDILKAIDKVYADGSINIGVYPIARAQQMIAGGESDIYMPKIISEFTDVSKLPYNLVSKPVGKATFVLYTNVNKKLTKKDLDDALSKGGDFPYKLESSPSLKESFKYPYTPTSNITESLQKLDAGRIDGLIWAQEDVDSLLRANKDKAVNRSFFYDFSDVIAVAKTEKGDKIGKALADSIGQLETSGELATLYANCHKPFEDWQPSDMGW